MFSAARRALSGLIPARAGRTRKRPHAVSMPRAHPRSRGADTGQDWARPLLAGSSPLARGGPAGQAPGRVRPGLIPARAGRTVGCCPERTNSRAHPRSRGADGAWAEVQRSIQGSSPLARGGPPSVEGGEPEVGLIPARAGRTSPRCAGTSRARAHPRSRGADDGSPSMRSPIQGSSPLARGGLRSMTDHDAPTGLIPARAGRTTCCIVRRTTSRAHPRSRGADEFNISEKLQGSGSSPLARGGLAAFTDTTKAAGLIPARAGRTSMRAPTSGVHVAHPRSRGADGSARCGPRQGLGSSPLARGGRIPVRRIARMPGLIPARAGRTASRPREPSRQRAHPRSRGADLGRPLDHLAEGGSSPLARGGHASG